MIFFNQNIEYAISLELLRVGAYASELDDNLYDVLLFLAKFLIFLYREKYILARSFHGLVAGCLIDSFHDRSLNCVLIVDICLNASD
ncbi:hypothetical protein Plhal304r1_c056g0141461 [Plasmopara halstedii]